MREISQTDLRSPHKAEDDKEKIAAIKKISEGLEVLARLNADVAQEMIKAMREIKHETHIDMTPMAEAIKGMKQDPVAYSVKINRNSIGQATTMEFTPQ